MIGTRVIARITKYNPSKSKITFQFCIPSTGELHQVTVDEQSLIKRIFKHKKWFKELDKHNPVFEIVAIDGYNKNNRS